MTDAGQRPAATFNQRVHHHGLMLDGDDLPPAIRERVRTSPIRYAPAPAPRCVQHAPGCSASTGTHPAASAMTRVTVSGAAFDSRPRGAAAQGRVRTGRAVPHTRDVCLVTSVTDTFVPGAVVMLDSFRAHHPDFEGDVVLLHDGLSEASRTILEAVGGRVRFEPVRPELLDRVARLWEAYPNGVQPATMFHTLDAFRLGGYRKVLYYDSDMLFQGPVGELFGAGGEALLCCGDWPCLMGRARDAETYRPLARTRRGAEAVRPVLERTFNGGFLLIDGSCTGERVYAELLARMAPEAWRGLAIRLGDQCVLNHYFAGRQTLASWTYNYPVSDTAVLRTRTGLDAERAKVLHFKGLVKPWTPDAMLRWACGEFKLPQRLVAAPFRRWYDAWMDVLARTHLRMVRSRLT